MAEGEDEIVAGVIKPLSESGKAIPQRTEPFTEAPAFVPLKPLSEQGATKPTRPVEKIIRGSQ